MGKNMFSQFKADESGATAVEYALVALIITVGMISNMESIAGSLSGIFNDASNQLLN